MNILEPADQEEFSDKLLVRLPKSLHRTLVQISKRERSVAINMLPMHWRIVPSRRSDKRAAARRTCSLHAAALLVSGLC